MPSEEMVFTKRTIFPFLIKVPSVPAGLRVFPSVSGRKFPYGEIFCRKNAPKAQVTDVKGIQKAKTATDVVHVRQGKELSGSPFSCRTPA